MILWLLIAVVIIMVVFMAVYLWAEARPNIARAICRFGAWRPQRDDDAEGL